jgi:hypothetical protein
MWIPFDDEVSSISHFWFSEQGNRHGSFPEEPTADPPPSRLPLDRPAQQSYAICQTNGVGLHRFQYSPRSALGSAAPCGDFEAFSAYDGFRFNPCELDLMPMHYWKSQLYSIGDLARNFFRKKNSTNARFPHKLYNALKLSDFDSVFTELVGVKWMNETVFRIDKIIFGKLLGIKAIEGSLFHRQGNFPTHKFVELQASQARETFTEKDLATVDFEVVRLVYHKPGLFVRNATPTAIENCKWVSCRQKDETWT